MKRIVNCENDVIYPASYRQLDGRYKPAGLWYSLNTEWVDWLTGENWLERIAANNIEIEVDLSKVLVLDTLEKIIDFQLEYKMFALERLLEVINWKRVALDYTGIEIRDFNDLKWQGYETPGFPMAGFTWFYGWDVSSGCVWDLSAVKQL